MFSSTSLRARLGLVILVAACGGSDAAPDPCGKSFEAEVLDLTTGAPVFEVLGTAGENTATSAPNGRIVLCVATPAPDVVEISLTKAGLLVTRVSVAPDTLVAGGEPFRARVSSAVDADTLATGLGAARNPAATLLVADFFLSTGAGATGAMLPITGNDGSFVRQSNAYVPGDTVGADPTLLFLNQTAGASLALAPSGSDCSGPDSTSLEVGGITYAPFRCTQ